MYKKKTDRCKNDPENSSTTKDCMKKFYESLREHAIKISKFRKKK